MARGLALFMGGFSLLNLVGDLRCRGFDANLWWIDLRPMGPWLSGGILAASAVLLIAFGIRGAGRSWRRTATQAAVTILLAAATANVIIFHVLSARNAIGTNCPIAFSLLVAAALVVILAGLAAGQLTVRMNRLFEVCTIAFTVGACTLGFPLAQMFCFGLTDYRRPADAAVVFGARVYADGTLSQAVADRVQTACGLYRDGLVHTIVVSGGPGDGDVHETHGMRRMALQLGVPATDILVDEQGLNTQATVRNTCEVFQRHGLHRILVVSHFYHLPRIKLAYQRRGCEVYTVPAKETYILTALPLYMAREVAALWVYYLRPLWSTE